MNAKVVILCGGMGTRLREETEYRPKPLVEIGGRPILWHIMKIYSHSGFKEFVLCLGYKGHMIKEYFLNYQLMNADFTLELGSGEGPRIHHAKVSDNWSITFAETGLDAMTGARVKRIGQYIPEDNFMLTYGDGVADINITKLWEYHKQHGKIGTVTGVRPISRYGELAIEGGRVREFSEKPQAQDGMISGGYFVFQRRFLDYLTDQDECVLERNPLQRLAQEGELMIYQHQGFWHCMDTYRDFLALNESWKNGAAWKVWD
ncbi:MAG: glucose-1-phosphate cytidylyltransferase [Terriglobia bacterium]